MTEEARHAFAGHLRASAGPRRLLRPHPMAARHIVASRGVVTPAGGEVYLLVEDDVRWGDVLNRPS
jgi:hypothetical protein